MQTVQTTNMSDDYDPLDDILKDIEYITENPLGELTSKVAYFTVICQGLVNSSTPENRELAKDFLLYAQELQHTRESIIFLDTDMLFKLKDEELEPVKDIIETFYQMIKDLNVSITKLSAFCHIDEIGLVKLQNLFTVFGFDANKNEREDYYQILLTNEELTLFYDTRLITGNKLSHDNKPTAQFLALMESASNYHGPDIDV